MKKITFILMAFCIGFASCSDDDDDPVETCAEYAKRYEAKFNELEESDLEGIFTLLAEYIENIPEGCEDLIDED